MKPEDLYAHCVAVEIDRCDTGKGLLRLRALASNRTHDYRHAETNLTAKVMQEITSKFLRLRFRIS